MKMLNYIKKYSQNILIFGLLFITIFNNYTNLRKVNFDHLLFDSHSFKDLIEFSYQFTIKSQGRTSYLQALLIPIEYLLPYYWIWCIFYLICIGVICGLIVYEILNKNIKYFLITLLIIISFYNITLEPIAMPVAYAFILGSAIITLLLSIYIYIKWIKYSIYRYKIVSCGLLLISCYIYEVAILYLPLIIMYTIYYNKNKKIKYIIISIKEFLITGIIYTATFILSKLQYSGIYEGTHINSINLTKDIYTILFILLSRMPGFSFFYNKSNAYKNTIYYLKNYNNIFNENDYSKNMFILLIFISIILFIICIIKIIKFEKKEVISNRNKNTFSWILIAIYTIVIPIVPSALTTYTQNQVAAHWRLEGICNQYSYCFTYISFVLMFNFLLNNVKFKKLVIATSFVLAIVIYSLTSFTNAVNSKIIYTLGDRFNKFDIVLNDLSEGCEENSIIYAPTLLSNWGVLSIPDGYLSGRIKYLTGKNIRVLSSLVDIDPNSDVYFLRYLYDTDSTEFVLGKVKASDIQNYEKVVQTTNNPCLLTNYVKVYCINELSNYYLVGNAQGEYININGDRRAADGTFSKLISSSSNKKKKFDVFNIIGEKINIISIADYSVKNSVINKTEVINLEKTKIGSILERAEIINGYWNDGWAASECVINIQSGNEGKLNISIDLPIKYDDFNLDVYANDSYIGSIKQNELNGEFNIIKNQIVNIKLVTQSSFLSKDGRTLSYLLCDMQCH